MSDDKKEQEPENTVEAPSKIDARIKSAQRKGVGVFFLSGSITLFILLSFLLWLFFVQGFKVIVGPSEALPSAKLKLLSGFAWVGDSNIYTLGGEISVEVSADTFQSAKVNIDSQSPSTIEIVLLPTPAQINAVVSTQDPDFSKWQDLTQWFLNGNLVHVGAKLAHKTAPGNYQLDVTHPYYQDFNQSLSLERAEEVSLQADFVLIEGSVSINSVPAGVMVSHNGEPRGNTPLKLALKGGEHRIELTSEDYETVTEVVPISASFLHPTRNYQLAPKPGIVNISAQPSDGLLLINAVEYALGEVKLAANKQHRISYSKAGFSEFSRTVSLDPSKPLDIAISLNPQFGSVAINTNVPALIKIDGQAMSQQAIQSIERKLSAVPHSIEASAQGYRTIKQTISIKPNIQTPVNINLLTEFDARRQEGKPLFVNQLGINMLRFRADAFTLGSPANETGRRRNEHQVELDFSRQFWVSTTEITQAQFAAFTGTPSSSKLPMTGVSWLQAAEYCNWLSVQEGLPVFYRFVNGRYVGVDKSSRGYRLPTEAEWEWLAKKSKRASSTVYIWGNQDKLRDKLGNFADKSTSGSQVIYFGDYDDGKKGVSDVASFDADRAGLYDLAGNVSEWVHDFYTNALPKVDGVQVDYLGSPSGESWVIKGGNYETGRLRELRAAYREFASAGKATVGFRIARYHQ